MGQSRRIASEKEIAGDKIVVPLEVQARTDGRIIVDVFKTVADADRQGPVGGITEMTVQSEITLIIQTCFIVFVVRRDPELVELRTQVESEVRAAAKILQVFGTDPEILTYVDGHEAAGGRCKEIAAGQDSRMALMPLNWLYMVGPILAKVRAFSSTWKSILLLPLGSGTRV